MFFPDGITQILQIIPVDFSILKYIRYPLLKTELFLRYEEDELP